MLQNGQMEGMRMNGRKDGWMDKDMTTDRLDRTVRWECKWTNEGWAKISKWIATEEWRAKFENIRSQILEIHDIAIRLIWNSVPEKDRKRENILFGYFTLPIKRMTSGNHREKRTNRWNSKDQSSVFQGFLGMDSKSGRGNKQRWDTGIEGVRKACWMKC